MPKFKSWGLGKISKKQFQKIGQDVVIEDSARIFNPQNLSLGSDIYIGHNTILDGYLNGQLQIDSRVWVGPQCFLHAAGGIEIGSDVGIGPGVKILTSTHNLKKDDLGPIIKLPLDFQPVIIEKNCDIGAGAIILPGVKIAEGTQVGAGAVVTKNTERYSIYAGVPAKKIAVRQSAFEGHKEPRKNQYRLDKFLFSVISHCLRYFFDLIFFLFLPIVIIYSWLRYFTKKISHQKPKIIFSPLGAPLPLFAVRACRTIGYRADNLAFDCPSPFRPISFGLILSDHFFLRRLIYLTDYTWLFLWAIFQYDIFEFPFSGGILMNSHLRKLELPMLKILAKKISVYGYGSDCKILSDIRKQGYKYNNAMDRAEETESQSEQIIRENLRRAQKYAQILIAGGDLIHLGPKAIMLSLATDLKLWPYRKLSKNKKIVTILHSTNHRSHKGTRFIIDIISQLETKLPIKLLLLEGKSFEECRRLYPQADFFITDVISGWHGFTAIEAMATGRPVITYLRDDIAKFHYYYAKNIPAISANPDNLAEAVTQLVKNPKLRQELGQKGRQYVLKYHSLEFVGALRDILYQHIWQNKKINQKIFEKDLKKRGLI